MSDDELDRLVKYLQTAPSMAARNAAAAITTLRARIAELEAFQQQAITQVCELAREAGEAKGKLEASELPGIVDGWREKCERLDRRVAALEKDRAEWVEVERLRMGKV